MLTMFNIRNNRHLGLRKMDHSSRKAKLLYILAIAYGLVHYFIVFAFKTMCLPIFDLFAVETKNLLVFYFLVLYIIAVVADQKIFLEKNDGCDSILDVNQLKIVK